MKRDVSTVLKKLEADPTELESLLYVAIDILGRMALRKRRKLWQHEIRQLEDELFEVLERLSDVSVSEHAAQVREELGSPDGTS